MNTAWERDLAEFLSELTAVQSELLDVLLAKRQCLMRSDGAGMAALQSREESIVARLEACQRRRQELLTEASAEGADTINLRSAAKTLVRGDSTSMRRSLDEAASRARILQHHSLTNWVVTQRTLLHLAQMLEIIATGGRTQPTYGNAAAPTGGCLVDQAA
jgi:flagellar biosynthesis/type III secretory pathway chaperone